MRIGATPMARAGFTDDASGHKMITRHFCANYGRRYNPSMELSTILFDDADPLMDELVHRAKAIVLERLGVDFEFNEDLCLAYLPEMSIGWYNDGGSGVGKYHLSHSFGANCEMKFAMKGAYWAGRKTNATSKVMLMPGDPHLCSCLKGR